MYNRSMMIINTLRAVCNFTELMTIVDTDTLESMGGIDENFNDILLMSEHSQKLIDCVKRINNRIKEKKEADKLAEDIQEKFKEEAKNIVKKEFEK